MHTLRAFWELCMKSSQSTDDTEAPNHLNNHKKIITTYCFAQPSACKVLRGTLNHLDTLQLRSLHPWHASHKREGQLNSARCCTLLPLCEDAALYSLFSMDQITEIYWERYWESAIMLCQEELRLSHQVWHNTASITSMSRGVLVAN